MKDEIRPEGAFAPLHSAKSDGVIKFVTLPLRNNSLWGLSKDFVFYTPAILYLSQLFDPVCLSHFALEYGSCRMFVHRFREPIFAGLDTDDGDKDWNRTIFAVEAEVWPKFERFLGSAVFVDCEKRLCLRVLVQKVNIADMAAHELQTLSVGPVEILSFGKDGNDCIEYLHMQDFELPRRQRIAPRTETVVYANALFEGKNPQIALDSQKLPGENR